MKPSPGDRPVTEPRRGFGSPRVWGRTAACARSSKDATRRLSAASCHLGNKHSSARQARAAASPCVPGRRGPAAGAAFRTAAGLPPHLGEVGQLSRPPPRPPKGPAEAAGRPRAACPPQAPSGTPAAAPRLTDRPPLPPHARPKGPASRQGRPGGGRGKGGGREPPQEAGGGRWGARPPSPRHVTHQATATRSLLLHPLTPRYKPRPSPPDKPRPSDAPAKSRPRTASGAPSSSPFPFPRRSRPAAAGKRSAAGQRVYDIAGLRRVRDHVRGGGGGGGGRRGLPVPCQRVSGRRGAAGPPFPSLPRRREGTVARAGRGAAAPVKPLCGEGRVPRGRCCRPHPPPALRSPGLGLAPARPGERRAGPRPAGGCPPVTGFSPGSVPLTVGAEGEPGAPGKGLVVGAGPSVCRRGGRRAGLWQPGEGRGGSRA